MHAFLSNLANRQTDKQTNTGKTCTPSFVGGKMNDRTIDHITLPALVGGVRIVLNTNVYILVRDT